MKEKRNMSRIYCDVSGGDNAPVQMIQGALAALRRNADLQVILGGDQAAIEPLLLEADDVKNRLSIDHCTQTITNHDAPALAVRRMKDSAIVKGMIAVKEGRADGFVSCGSTGAVLMAGILRLQRIEGIDRPALAPLLPNGKDYFLLIDSGANVDCMPEYLVQFALMGEEYMRLVRGIEKPRVGLINIGAEEEKGNALVKGAYPLLQKSIPTFVGNVEARDITGDQADVLVCDGFTGNIVLKFMEGVAMTLLGIIKKELLSSTVSKIGALLAKPAFKRVKNSFDYREVGGAPLLGVNGAVVKGHGSSDARAFSRAIEQCILMHERDVAGQIAKNIQPILQEVSQ
jgi:glycerol-3-phosphate acyltransferase PlsX